MVEKEKIMEDIRSGDIVKLTVQSPRIVRSFKKYLHLKEAEPFDLAGYAFIRPEGVEIGIEFAYLGKSTINYIANFEDILSYTVLVKKYPS